MLVTRRRPSFGFFSGTSRGPAVLCACAAVVALAACGDAGLPGLGGDARDGGSASDGGRRDGGATLDGGSTPDGGATPDGGSTADGGSTLDGGQPAEDGGVKADGGSPDAGPPDAGVSDAGPPDAGVSDAGVSDAGVPAPDAGTCDTRTVPEPTRCPDDGFPAQPTESWRDEFQSAVLLGGSPRHRCIDAVANPGDEQWLAAKVAYGVNDDDLEDENVDVWVNKPINGVCTWQNLGGGRTTETTFFGGGNTFDPGPIQHKGLGPDLVDDGGRLFFQIPTAARLPAGSYPIRFRVRGDNSFARCTLNVWPRGTHAFVSDIDGTITTEENDGLWTALDPLSPVARVSTQEVHAAYVSKGYRLIYLTARPEMLLNGTKEWFRTNNYPTASFHLSQSNFGEFGAASVEYKGGYLAALRDDQGVSWDWAYGNKDSDLEAYLDHAHITPDHVRLISGEFTGNLRGAVMIDSYTPEIERVRCLPPVTQP